MLTLQNSFIISVQYKSIPWLYILLYFDHVYKIRPKIILIWESWLGLNLNSFCAYAYLGFKKIFELMSNKYLLQALVISY